ncbi:phenylacetate--CoA ligase family protein [Winogradskyella aurantiaca]|uniref:phenylacetate--CoA ligase family protein n=1 Tax=Winogradskyella aurantiaca TaxID=2219558 RepID=UPI002936DE9F|nr:phenylacetate--CoA ligase family protein [Winogradskyella aurantiaca]
MATLQKLDRANKQLDIINRRNHIVEYHIENNPYYEHHFLSSYNNQWESVPIMTKQDLQRPLKERLSNGFSNKTIYVNKTSGSSGDPFIFAKDKWCHAMTWAQIMDRFSWYGIDFNSSSQARFYGIPLDFIGNKKERLKDWFSNRYRFSVFDLSDTAFEECLVQFKATAFEFINGYTSPIVQFAKFLKRKGLILTDVCPSLRVCIVTSEMLFDSDRSLMQERFGVPVVNEYGASELDLIAFENTHGELQLNNDTLYVEIVDENDKVLPYGKEGRIIITSLFNKAHPFIRYDLGDIGIIEVKENSPYPILKKLTGRTNDLVQLPSGKTAAGLTFYYVTKSVIEESGNVKEFVIEQAKIEHFNIVYASKNELTPEQKVKIETAISQYLEDGLTISYKRVPQLKRSASGKLKQFHSKIY